jgi:hypothetical protein
LGSRILGHGNVSFWTILLMLSQEVIEFFGNLGGNVSLAALLAHISRYIFNNEQLLTKPDFQSGLVGL